MRTPVHVVGGYLGTGKTTVLLTELGKREGNERCAVVVNDFGEAAVDATLLGDGVRVTNIPGGCVCCTAPEGLAPALIAILDELKPDRIFIEPSGLARPRAAAKRREAGLRGGRRRM
jgi:G3E family GTPase